MQIPSEINKALTAVRGDDGVESSSAEVFPVSAEIEMQRRYDLIIDQMVAMNKARSPLRRDFNRASGIGDGMFATVRDLTGPVYIRSKDAMSSQRKSLEIRGGYETLGDIPQTPNKKLKMLSL